MRPANLDTSLTLVTAPTEEPVSLDELKADRRIPATVTDDDAHLTRLITRARTHFENTAARQVMAATWLLSLPGFPSYCEGPRSAILLPKPPAQSVTQIQYLDSNSVLQTLSSSLYTFDAGHDRARIYPALDHTWPETRSYPGAVKITFVAGFPSAADVPETIKGFILALAGHWYEHREAASEDSIKEVPFELENLFWGERSLEIV